MSDHELSYSSEESDIDEKPLQLQIKQYPLNYTWVVYDHTKSDSDTYEASTRMVCEFSTVIKFWQIFNNYPKPSMLFNNGVKRPVLINNSVTKEISSISVFKKGILPKWEDPVNKFGAEFSKRKFNKKDPLEELDNNWIDILIACVGCIIDNSVTGVRVVDSSSFKKNELNVTEFKLLYRIEIWFDNIGKKEIIEKQFKDILCVDDSKSIHYKEHKI